MEFFCYHRDRAGAGSLRQDLLEEHLTYMDRFSAEMIARGPTFDGEDATGSMHMLDLASVAAARAFAFDERRYQAGVYRDVMIRRWRNDLGRTMWDFAGGPTGGHRYLVLGLGVADGGLGPVTPRDQQDLIGFGPLLSDDGTVWLGSAALVRADDEAGARAVLAGQAYDVVEVHHWQFGGRPA